MNWKWRSSGFLPHVPSRFLLQKLNSVKLPRRFENEFSKVGGNSLRRSQHHAWPIACVRITFLWTPDEDCSTSVSRKFTVRARLVPPSSHCVDHLPPPPARRDTRCPHPASIHFGYMNRALTGYVWPVTSQHTVVADLHLKFLIKNVRLQGISLLHTSRQARKNTRTLSPKKNLNDTDIYIPAVNQNGCFR